MKMNMDRNLLLQEDANVPLNLLTSPDLTITEWLAHRFRHIPDSMIGTIVCYQDWVQVAVLLCIEAAAFLILFCGCFIEVTVDMLRGYVSDRLLS